MTKRNGESEGGGDDWIFFIIIAVAVIGGVLYFKSRLTDVPRTSPYDFRDRDARPGPEQLTKYPLVREDERMNRPPPLDPGGTMIDPGLIEA